MTLTPVLSRAGEREGALLVTDAHNGACTEDVMLLAGLPTGSGKAAGGYICNHGRLKEPEVAERQQGGRGDTGPFPLCRNPCRS